jgi:hypothetical protein
LAELSIPKRVILAGMVVAALGTFSNLLGDQGLKLMHSFEAFQVYADATLIVQLVGLLVVLVGGIMSACSAPMNRVAWWGLSVATIAIAVVQILNVSLMDETAILVPVFYGAELTAISMLLISGLRFATKRWSAD